MTGSIASPDPAAAIPVPAAHDTTTTEENPEPGNATSPENDVNTPRLDAFKPPETAPSPLDSADSPLSELDSPPPPDPELDDLGRSCRDESPEVKQESAQNGVNHTDDDSELLSAKEDPSNERPAKRRRVDASTPPPDSEAARLIKPVSPPWKRFEAEGPTTFQEDGKRRSGRVNAVPIEQQPQGKKRITRGALHDRQVTSTATKARSASTTNGHVNNAQRHVSNAKGPATKPAPAAKASIPTRKSLTNPVKSSPRTQRPSASSPAQSTPLRQSTRARRSSRTFRESFGAPLEDTSFASTDSPNSRPTRIRLRVPRPTSVPIVHPYQINVPAGQYITRPKIGTSFEDYTDRAYTIEVKDGGWQDVAEDGPPYTEELALKDAITISRIEEEAEDGGLLTEARASVFVPEPAEEPPKQWAHMDHLVKAMANFRRLMVMENQRHRAAAKRLAEACRDEWLRRQPKSAEQIEAEARLAWIGRYRIVVKALAGTWENVKTEINRRRLEEWEAAEQKRVKAALNEAVNKSELQLQARRAHFDSEMPSSEDELDDDLEDPSDVEDNEVDEDEDMDSDRESGSDSSGSDEDEEKDDDNMSSSEDEEDAKSEVSDANLTQEQLQLKYANVPDLPAADAEAQEDGTKVLENPDNENDTSDESIDMDDDLGSSDEGMTSEEGEEGDDGTDNEESEEEDDQPSGLLGLFFGKSELKKMKEEASTAVTEQSTEDVEMADLPEAQQDETQPVTNGVGPHDDGDEMSLVEPVTEGAVDAVEKKSSASAASETQTAVLETDESLTAEVDPPKDPLEANKPDAPVSIPAPLDPVAVGTEIANAVEQSKENRETDDKISASEVAPAAIPSVEVKDAPQATPETDGITNPPSRDRSQSPRTSDDTKPSDVDTASSVVKTGVSRSTSPQLTDPKTEIPFLLRGTLREYQHFGLDWLAGLYKNNTNGILADEMGLGKTIQTIALLAHLACHHEVWGPHLVIVPTSVMLNWEMEFKKWCPGFKVLSYYGSIEERKRKRQGWKTDDMWNVCITSYQIVLQDQQVFKRRQWHYMILDEAHNIKNFKSKRWQTLLTFNTRARLLLTGTPLQNNLTELWSLLFFLMPSANGVGGFADLAEFQDWFHKPESQILESGREQMDDEARAIIAKLHKVLRPYLLRRLKADVEKQMPAKYEHVEFCRLSRRQRELYDGFLARADTRQALAAGNYISVLNCLMQLRKVCNHPDLFVERPIMTSFRQSKSVIAAYEATESLVKGKLLSTPLMNIVSLNFLNLIPTKYEGLSATACDRISHLSSHRALMELREAQKVRAANAFHNLDPATVESNIVYLESNSRKGIYEDLQHCVYLNALRGQQRPVYGKQLTDFLTLDLSRRPHKPRPRIPAKIISWFEEESPALHELVPTLDERAASMQPIISKFACITPAVVTRDIDRFVLGSKGVKAFGEENLRLAAPVRYAPFIQPEAPIDPYHESRMRLSIQFPDRRLLQYDCGKLQALDRLLRKLQAGGHRALIFTQMTKVLDILEKFLNIHGHKYLRLDGATKVEQRQILTDRFNHDTNFLCFILSTRSGGLGINLTGADTVIFYDQDWNPAMDKQCQDRCHRIGQTRDVHIYRLVSEHTIEANILRKASQKQMLDDVVIQEGGFTTDYFNKMSVQDVMASVTRSEGDMVGDAMDRVLGGVEGSDTRTARVLEQAEDREDVDAARVAEKEIQTDDADFSDKPSASGTSSARQGTPSGLSARDGSAAPGRSNLGIYSENADDLLIEDEAIEQNAWGERMRTIDDYMLGSMAMALEGTVLELPKDKKKSKKKGKDRR